MERYTTARLQDVTCTGRPGHELAEALLAPWVHLPPTGVAADRPAGVRPATRRDRTRAREPGKTGDPPLDSQLHRATRPRYRDDARGIAQPTWGRASGRTDPAD